MSKAILGISAYYHDSAAALVVDGAIKAAAQEERFSRKRHDAGFPGRAIEYCLGAAGIGLGDVEAVVFYDKPFIKFERLLETYLALAPRGFRSFVQAIPVWLKEKLYLKQTLRRELAALGGIRVRELPSLLFAEHHQSHAASAFYPSPFERAAVLCLDGVGEWATSSVWYGDGNRLQPLWEIDFPHSLGLLYSAFTHYCGFRVNSGEYKLMGLAPYGKPRYVDVILDNLMDLKADGTFRLDLDYFNFAGGLTMTGQRFHKLFGALPRTPEGAMTQQHLDLARSIQAVTEKVVLRLARTVQRETGAENLCLAGGVALNCVVNGRLLREGPFRDVWVQPAAGDAGGALGAALAVWYGHYDNERRAETPDSMGGAYLGPGYGDGAVRAYLDQAGARYHRLQEPDLLCRAALLLAEENVVGWFRGRMEFGPRALGARSILGDPRSAAMQSVMNLKIKYRESFRPFAPAVKYECVGEWFEQDRPSDYMTFVTAVAMDKRLAGTPDESASGLDKLSVVRSRIPAVTHVDYSARVQTVHRETNPAFHGLLDAFEAVTGCPVLVNTSFNVRGEPIVCTPEDAWRCFMRTGMDALVIGDCLLLKSEQAPWTEVHEWRGEIVPD